MNKYEIVKIGDTVVWRGSWGQDAPKHVKVTGLTVTEFPREKDGISVDEAYWLHVNQNRVIFDLDNGHWAYGSQISPVVKTESVGSIESFEVSQDRERGLTSFNVYDTQNEYRG